MPGAQLVVQRGQHQDCGEDAADAPVADITVLAVSGVRGVQIPESGPEFGLACCAGAGLGGAVRRTRVWSGPGMSGAGAGLMATSATYTRRRPELDPLYQIMSEHLATFLAQAEHEGSGVPDC